MAAPSFLPVLQEKRPHPHHGSPSNSPSSRRAGGRNLREAGQPRLFSLQQLAHQLAPQLTLTFFRAFHVVCLYLVLVEKGRSLLEYCSGSWLKSPPFPLLPLAGSKLGLAAVIFFFFYFRLGPIPATLEAHPSTHRWLRLLAHGNVCSILAFKKSPLPGVRRSGDNLQELVLSTM